ncbi:MAG: PH domain-containing protein [Candidatus Thermoplasmatota archaeon]
MVGKPSGLDLTSDEKLVWSGRRSLRTFLIPIFVSFLMILGGIALYIGILPYIDLSSKISLYASLALGGIGFLILIRIYIKRLTTIYAVTNEKVYSRVGFFSREIESAMLDEITDNELEQSITGRIFGYGTVKFNTAGSSDMEVTFKDITNPHDRISEVYSFEEE